MSQKQQEGSVSEPHILQCPGKGTGVTTGDVEGYSASCLHLAFPSLNIFFTFNFWERERERTRKREREGEREPE